MWPPTRVCQALAQFSARGLRDDCLVGFDDIDVRAGFSQFVGYHVAGDFGPHQQDSLPFHAAAEAADYGLCDVFFGNNINSNAALLDCFLRGWADGGNAQSVSG